MKISDQVLPEGYNTSTEQNIVNFLQERSGIVIDNSKKREIRSELLIRLADSKIKELSKYFLFLKSSQGRDELDSLINFITINETFFFRIPEHFDILATFALEDLKKKYCGEKIKIWSAGCSSGEEAYSIAITLLENNFDNFEILGTDINYDMIYLAEKGIYTGRTLNNVTGKILNKYFDPFLDKFQVKAEIRDKISFRYLNIIKNFEDLINFEPHIIFFRNVMIYFDEETIKEIINKFSDLLCKNGFLIIGQSESLWNLSDKFTLHMFESAYIYQNIIKEKVVHKKEDTRSILKSRILKRVEKTEPKVTEPADREQESAIPDEKSREKISLENAELMLELGEYKKAEHIVNNLLKRNKREEKALLIKGMLLINQNRSSEFENHVSETLSDIPVFPELIFLKAVYKESQSLFRESALEYKKVLFIDRDYLLPRYRLLKVLVKLNDKQCILREAQNIIRQIESERVKTFKFKIISELNSSSVLEECRDIIRKL